MLAFITISAVILVIGLYTSLGARAYRDPRLVPFAGLLASAAAAAAKGYLIRFKTLPASPFTSEKLEMAGAVVDPTLVVRRAAARADVELRLVANSLSDKEFRERLAIVKEAQYRSALEQPESESRLRSAKLPGAD